MSQDSDAVQTLCALPGFATAKVLHQLYNALSPDLPHHLRSTAVPPPPGLADAAVLHFNFDEGHAARFMVPGTVGGSVDFDWVLDRPHPLRFVMTHLAVRAPDAPPQPEHVIFMPGLNTFQQPRAGETTTEQRLKYYARVLRTASMAQLHPGTSKDQGDVRLHAKRAVVLRLLLTALRPVLPDRVEPRIEGADLIFSASQLDYIQAALSAFNLIDTPLKARIRDLLQRTKRDDAEPVVLIGYSRSSIDLRAALEKHVEQCLDDGESQQHIEERLRRLVTVVTIGPGTSGYPDGPAYVHVATYQDPLSSLAGVTSRTRAERAGRDAMFVNTDSPFADGAFDAHNFGAVTVQYLALVMAANGVNGFRQLWDKHMAHELVALRNEHAVLRAMIVLTDGTEWLFSPPDAWKGLGSDALPDAATAESVVREAIGDAFADRVVELFGAPRKLKNPPPPVRHDDGGDEPQQPRRGWGCAQS